jgi:CheY-like chemotaxis protein/predicted transcriptional regulator
MNQNQQRSKAMNKDSILVIDDNPTNLSLLVDTLTKKGYKILAAEDGESALEILDHTRPDLILLDVLMPGIDGFETCRRLKAEPTTREIPVIFMTALSDSIDEVKGLELGAVDYIIKPFQIETLLARINTHLTVVKLQTQLQARVEELEAALDKVKLLSGMLPICANCKNIRDDKGYWHQVEIYIHNHSEADFSHGVCPDCAKELYPELYNKLAQRKQDILDILAQSTQATLKDIATGINIPENNTFNYLQNMITEGDITEVKTTGDTYYRLSD